MDPYLLQEPLESIMSSLPPIPTYSGELEAVQDEFTDTCLAHLEIHTREKRRGFCQCDMALTMHQAQGS